MKTKILNFVLVLLLPGMALAELYRGVDAQGNVIYSDTPFESAEKYTPPPISVVGGGVKAKKDAKTEEGAVEDAATQEDKPFRYLQFDILRPTANETIYNPVQLMVSLRLKPGLNTADGHTISLLLDKKPVVKKSEDTAFALDPPERGAHQLQGQIRDKNGKIVGRTRAVVFFIKRGSVR